MCLEAELSKEIMVEELWSSKISASLDAISIMEALWRGCLWCWCCSSFSSPQQWNPILCSALVLSLLCSYPTPRPTPFVSSSGLVDWLMLRLNPDKGMGLKGLCVCVCLCAVVQCLCDLVLRFKSTRGQDSLNWLCSNQGLWLSRSLWSRAL